MRYLLIFFILFATQQVAAQKMPEDYFDEATAYIRQKKYQQAAAGYSYIVRHHKRHELYPESFYNLGYTYWLMDKTDSALLFFRAILKSDFDEKKEIGVDIMANPYANFRHRASSHIRDIYYD